MIRDVTTADATTICQIYNYYIDQTVVTFEEESLEASTMLQRIAAVTAQYPWLVFEEDGAVLGYAYANYWKDRSAYRATVEVTVYVAHTAKRRGIGSRLYAELLTRLASAGVHAAIGVISLPNDDSVRFHEKFGFVKAGHLREVGLKFGKIIDSGLWQLLIEQKSMGAFK